MIKPPSEGINNIYHIITEFYNKYSILSDRNTNFPLLPNSFFKEQGFYQLPIDNKLEVDFNPEDKIDFTNEDLAKYNNNTIYCHLSRLWFACLNKEE
jgi:hypothetical protein